MLARNNGTLWQEPTVDMHRQLGNARAVFGTRDPKQIRDEQEREICNGVDIRDALYAPLRSLSLARVL